MRFIHCSFILKCYEFSDYEIFVFANTTKFLAMKFPATKFPPPIMIPYEITQTVEAMIMADIDGFRTLHDFIIGYPLIDQERVKGGRNPPLIALISIY